MRKNILFVIVLVQNFIVFGQETPGYQVPNFAPKTPEAASFLKYGEYPVDLSTGVPNISIPLYSIDLGGYKMPISLDYHASGIKVTQESTWVGLGWNLNFGAQIVLSVRDDVDENNLYIDEMPDDVIIDNYFDAHPYNFTGGIISSQNLDKSRVKDVYSFSSPTANGNFYIRDFDTNDVVIFPPNASFKVELLALGGARAQKFKITDSNGNEYYFTDTREISERTMTHGNSFTSAWYVDKIKTATNKEIDFVYQDGGTINDYIFSQRIEVSDKRTTYPAGVTGGPESCPNYYRQHSIGAIKNEGGSTMIMTKKISEILFNEGKTKVVFERVTGRDDLSINGSFLNLLLVKQWENGSFLTKKGYDFNYSYFISTNNENNQAYKNMRLRLDNVVDIIDGSGHTFVYSDINMPSKVSKARDYFGYYNGASNGTLIPTHVIYDSSFFPPISEIVGNANRNVNPIFNQAGILKEIHYPTKGWTKFNYETNQYFGIDEFERYDLHTLSSNTLQGTSTNNVDPSTFELPGINNIPQCTLPNPNNCVNYREIPFTCTNASGNLEFQVFFDGSISNPEIRHFYARVKILDNGGLVVHQSSKIQGNQTIKIPFSNLQSGSILMEVFGSPFKIEGLSFKYININNLTPKNLYGAGLRVANIENYNHDSKLLLKKQFEYNDLDNSAKTSGKLVNDLSTKFTSQSITNYSYGWCTPGDLGGMLSTLDSQATYNILSNSRFGIEGNTVVYKTVKESVVDSYGIKNGYTVYDFSTNSDDIPLGDQTVQIQTSWKRGKMLKKMDYKLVNNSQAYLVKEESNNYIDDVSKFSVISGFKMFRHSNVNVSEDPSNPLVMPLIMTIQPQTTNDGFIETVRYNLSIPWHYLKSTVVKDYFYDANNLLIGNITNTKVYNYNNPIHLQLSSFESTTSTGENKVTKYFYPQDVEMITEQPVMNSLIAKNIISTPIKIQTLQNNVLLSEHRTLYYDWGNSLILPQSIQSSKGASSSFENRVQFNAYDLYGNPLEFRQANGTIISYLWGYNKSQPIAKFENASNAQIKSALGVNDLNLVNETNLSSINALRINTSFANTMITTFTYSPLFGVSTVTDPKGDIIKFFYDSFGRLSQVKDKSDKILSENEYHYKN